MTHVTANKINKYICPCCQGVVSSSVQTGQIDHRHACGQRFRVRQGRIVAKAFVYECPYCAEKVTSKVTTGQINHRSVCGNRFYVRAGAINAKTRQHRHTCPACGSAVWSSRRFGRIQVVHQMPSGKECRNKSWQVRDENNTKTK